MGQVLNNQETNRNAVSELADERTRFEMYYPPFAGAVAAEAGSVMCSYNKINGVWSCENPVTLGKDFKKTAGFKGYVMSDWGATHSTSIMAGLDVVGLSLLPPCMVGSVWALHTAYILDLDNSVT